MHILLTDVLTCPRCGPEFGLIVLADAMTDRDIREGRLGCANCREEYLIRGGTADLRLVRGDGMSAVADASGASLEDRAIRGAALLGVGGTSSATAVVLGGEPELVEAVRGHLPESQVLGASNAEPEGGAGGDWVLVGEGLPLRTGAVRGVLMASGVPGPWLPEIRRVLAADGRLVVDPAAPGTAEDVVAAGFELLLDQAGVVVASRPAAR